MTATPTADRADLSPQYEGRDPQHPRTPTLLDWKWAEQRLGAATNYWVTSSSDGRPHPRPLWGLWHDNVFWFTVLRSSRTARNLASNPQVAVNLESAREVVTMDGAAEEVAADELESLFALWLAKYAGATADALDPAIDRVVYRVRPRVVIGWTLDDFPSNLTRWRFPS